MRKLLEICLFVLAQQVYGADKHSFTLDELSDFSKFGDSFSYAVIDTQNSEYERAVKLLKEKGAKCLNDWENMPSKDNHPQFSSKSLSGGAQRLTLAYHSSNATKVNTECLELKEIEKMFDQVHAAFSKGLEKLVGKKVEWNPNAVDSTKINFESAPHKAHIHSYVLENAFTNKQDDSALPMHTDNGLYVLLTPADVSPLQIIDDDGKEISLSGLSNDKVIMMIGNAIPDWLFEKNAKLSKYFRAVAHRVPKLDDDADRVVKARMYIAENAAVVEDSDQTFHDSFMSLRGKRQLSDIEISNVQQCNTSDGKDGAMCWMSCMVIPDKCQQDSAGLACEVYKNDTTPPAFQNCWYTDEDKEQNPDSKIMGKGCQWQCAAANQLNDFGNSASTIGPINAIAMTAATLLLAFLL